MTSHLDGAPPFPKIAVCLPAVIDPDIRGGGHLNTVRFADLLGQRTEVELLSYGKREDGVGYLPDEADRLIAEGWALLVTWGPDVASLVTTYYGRLPMLYYQQSLDWGFELPPDVPVLSMSRFMMTYAQRTWPHSPQFYLPPVLPRACRNNASNRDIDVLVVPRKQPSYIFETLLPMLETRCNVHVLDRFVPRDELYALFNRTKVYLYAFAPQRSKPVHGGWRLMEGISTQDLEAMSCGCTVVSDLRGGHGDFIEPEVLGYRLMSHSPDWDVEQVMAAIAEFPQPGTIEHQAFLQAHYGEARFFERAERLLAFLARFYRFASENKPSPMAFGVPGPIGPAQATRESVVGWLYRRKQALSKRGSS